MRKSRLRFSYTVFAIATGLYFTALTANSFGKCVSARPGSTVTIDVQACVDGRDLLIIQGNILQWEHLDFVPVGLHPDCPDRGDAPTIVTSTLNGHKVLNKRKWTPTWPSGTASGARSSVFSALCPKLPTDSQLSVTLTPVQARGSLSIFQDPSPANDETTVLDFDDDTIADSAPYEAL